jgi:hypothetical protein
LTSPVVSVLGGIEQTTLTLWYEFLEGWFDGGVHEIDDTEVTFPLVNLAFQQGGAVAPMDGISIAFTWISATRARRSNEGVSKTETIKAHWSVWVRAKGENKGQGGAAVLSKRTSDLIYALMSNRKATMPLARSGIRHVWSTTPALVSSQESHVRALRVSATLRCVAETG